VNNLRVRSAFHRNNIELAIPVYFQQSLIGLICLLEKESGENYSDEELDVLQTFANQIALAIANARLVQERINLEATVYQSEKLNSLGLLASSMAHEIKNPLSSIKTIIQVLQEHATGDDRNDLNVVVSEIDRLNSVVNKLLGFARPSDAGKTWFHVEETVKDVLSLLDRHAAKKDVHTSFKANSKLPQIYASKQSLREVILNLVINSIQSMLDGGEVKVETQILNKSYETSMTNMTPANPSSWIEIKIIDNGPGMESDVLEHIFAPFFSTKSVGTGLGMVIVKRNLEEMNAALQIESKEGKGTCVKMALPVEEKIESD
jgi:signal transduction histidine kinase